MKLITFTLGGTLFAGAALAEPCLSETIVGKWMLETGVFCNIKVAENGEFPLTRCGLADLNLGVSFYYGGRLKVSKDCAVEGTLDQEIHRRGEKPSKDRKRVEAWISGDRTRIDGVRFDKGERDPNGSFRMIRQSGLD